MRVAITGASGLIGSALVPHLRSHGHEVLRLVRRLAAAPDEISWDPTAGTVDLEALAGVDGVVHLAGAGVGDHRWTESYKREILQSRVQGTSTIARAMAALDPKPRALVCGSAIGYYGNRGDTPLDETSAPGTGFLADVVVAWEAAAAPAQEAGIRTTFARTGLVVAKGGGAFAKLMPIFRLGAGGKVGSGSQYWSFISLSDEIDALTHLLESDLSGPVNLTAPTPVTNAEATAALGKLLHRPTLLPVPAFALKAVLGEFADDVLSSARVLPRVLEASGFTFSQPTISEALRAELV
ncbi:MAG: TIGR01777 family protein [Actinobacteria bacterium]|uniref:Unannotated protein n=1 Tax=freshwater metagenome TaxID=449393 RepID=A0A6J7LHX2_9ZZZZ|nr:TIGR01777 family protein [Actinomycetota bacterium]